MQRFTADYLTRHALFHDVTRYVDTVVHFARFCTAPGTSPDGLTASCMYMAWVLHFDDVGDGTVGELGGEATRALCEVARAGTVPTGTPYACASAARALSELLSVVRRIAARTGLSIHEFTERVVAMMTAQQWERDRVAARLAPPSRAEYLRVRPDAIGNGAFVSIQKLDRAIDVERFDPLTRARAVLLDELTSRLVYLSNDILSQHREERDPSAASIIRVIAMEEGIPWERAVVRATHEHAADVDSYVRVRAELLSGHDADARRFAVNCDANVAGNLAAMSFIASRYRA